MVKGSNYNSIHCTLHPLQTVSTSSLKMSRSLYCCVLFILVWPLQGEQCKPQSVKPCVAECNGTSFDLSNVFHFPMTISGYTWNPCTGVKCSMDNGTTDKCAVCQPITDSYVVCCGQTSNPVWIWETDQMKLSSKLDKFPDWQIEYTFGATWRMSVFSFVIEEEQEEPIVEFVGEDVLTYNFHVIGKCIGQQTFECQKHYDKVKHTKKHGH